MVRNLLENEAGFCVTRGTRLRHIPDLMWFRSVQLGRMIASERTFCFVCNAKKMLHAEVAFRVTGMRLARRH